MFVNFIIKRDMQEVKEICIARYIAGLRFDIDKVFFLQPYHSLQDVMKISLKVGTKKMYGNSTTKSVAKEGFVEGFTSWNPNGIKTTPHSSCNAPSLA